MTAYIQSPDKLAPMGNIMTPIHILVAEENPQDLVDISQMLGDMGYEVMTASSGSRAIALSTGRHIDIVLTSGQLPDMNGLNLMTEIKRNAGDRHIPVIIMVPQTDKSSLSEYMAAGGDDFLCKPVSREQMLVRMSAITRYRDLRQQYTHYLREQRIIKQVIAKTVETCSEDINGVRVYSEPFAEVGGDMVLFGRLPSGDPVVLFSDFVGHGLSSAIGIFPVADVFSRRIAEGVSPRRVIDHINTKLHTILPTGMYMAACMLVIDSQLQHVQVWNGGMPDIYVLDGESGNIRERAVSRCMPLGINETVDEACCFQQIPISQGDSLLMHSDGITDAQNQAGAMFGSHELELFIERAETGEQAFQTLVDLFNSPAAPWQTTDDVTMVYIPLVPRLGDSGETGVA